MRIEFSALEKEETDKIHDCGCGSLASIADCDAFAAVSSAFPLLLRKILVNDIIPTRTSEVILNMIEHLRVRSGRRSNRDSERMAG
jgi:hypothetical protein